ncbi:MAG: ATP-binding protein, partial [Tangfeifania sp.]
LNIEKNNLVSFLKNIFFSFESLSASKNILLLFNSEKENIPLYFDPDKMETIFYNLLSNAFKFTDGPGEISLSVRLTESMKVEIILEDTGIGIPEDQLKHIFDRFYQADSSSIRMHEGTGIGLTLVKELVELHKGNITARSKPGKGTAFTIELPLDVSSKKITASKEISITKPNYKEDVFEPEAAAAIKKAASETGEKEKLKKLILVVEDNPDVRNYISEQLKPIYRVCEARNGNEGLSAARKELPDLIITDVMMPQMDGYEFSIKLRNDELISHIPVVMLTAKAGFDDKIQGLETGIDVFLTKPFSAKELKIRIKNLIRQREQLRKRFSNSTVIKPSEVSVISADQKFLKKTLAIIEANFHDEKFSVDLLANKTNMSVSQLNRKLNALIDQPAGQLIRSLRLQRASDLLKQNAGSISEICYNLGFTDQAYFSRAFKKQFGVSPRDYKEKQTH